jgi:hypothetical protein
MAFNKQYVDNPLNTRTKLLYLGDTYKKMVLNGLIIHNYNKDSNVLQEYDETDDIISIKKQYDEILDNHSCVIGRGIYNGFLVKKKKRGKKKKPHKKKIFYRII